MAKPAGTAKKLRSGYTTGACAAAAAKAAVLGLLGRPHPGRVAIPFPDGSRHAFDLCRFGTGLATVVTARVARAAAGDRRVWPTLPWVWLTKVVWCLGASHGRLRGVMPMSRYRYEEPPPPRAGTAGPPG